MNIHDATEEAHKRGYEDGVAEHDKTVCKLRKNWQSAETHICTMCGHFDHKTDGNIVYGNKNCGELVGYPYCGKFTPWIPVSERLPEKCKEYLCLCNIDGHTDFPFYMVLRYYLVDKKPHFQHECAHGLNVTHWMPLPEPPKGDDYAIR